jgi:hypothetical protein
LHFALIILPFCRRCALGTLAFGLALLAHGECLASCGDYVLVRDANGKLVPASQLAAGEQRAAEHSSAPMKRPCHGPECSQLPTRPPAVPTVPIHWPSAPEAALEQGGDGSDRPESDQPETSSGPLHPIHHPGGIFRPPR